jgi:hypothetical protein
VSTERAFDAYWRARARALGTAAQACRDAAAAKFDPLTAGFLETLAAAYEAQAAAALEQAAGAEASVAVAISGNGSSLPAFAARKQETADDATLGRSRRNGHAPRRDHRDL